MRSGNYDSSQMRDAIDRGVVKTTTTTTLSTATSEDSFNNADRNSVQS
jgi:hypothetical protein